MPRDLRNVRKAAIREFGNKCLRKAQCGLKRATKGKPDQCRE